MLEGLAAWVLKTYIGKYINVNPDKLSIGLLSGVVELENVPLNPDIFNDLNFPFELKTGFFGKIKLNVPLNTFRTSSWLLQAEKLCIKLGPKDYHKTVYKPFDVNQKLNELESKWFKEVELLGLDESKSDKKSVLFKYLTPIAYSLLNNINVSINELDIRYEDEKNNISFGLKIESISIKNDSEVQNIENLDHSENLSSKLFELKNFSVYSTSFTSDKVDLLIEPTSFKAHLIRDLSQKPLRRRKQARIRIQTQLATLKMNIGQKNLENLCQIIQFCNTYSNYVFNNRFRSGCTTRWSLLLKSISYHVKKASWQDLIKWAHDVSVYRRIIQQIYLGDNLNEDWVGEKKRIETEWDYDRLLIIRRAVFEKFVLSEQFISSKRAQPATVKTTMFNYLNFYGIFSKNSKSDPKLEEEVMTLINDTIENDTLLRRDCLLAVLEFKLDQWQINVDQIAKFKLEHTELVIEALPRFDSFLFEMNLSSFYLIDSINEYTTFFPNLVYPQKVMGPAQVFSLSYEHNPVNSKNSNLTIKSCGFDCIFNRDFYSQLFNFSQNVSLLFQKAGQVLLAKNLKPTKSFSLKTSPIHKITFNFEIIAPKILVPKEYDNQDSNCLILDFGKLTFKNKDLVIQKNDYWENDDDYDDSDSEEFVTPVSTPPNEPEDEFDPDLSKYYSNFDLDLNNLQVLSGKLQSNNLRNQLTKGHSDFHLLEKFNINIQLGILMKINPNQQVSFLFNSQLAPVRLMANVKLLKLNIDDFKLINLYETSQLFKNLIQKNDKSKRDKFKLPFRHRNVKKFVEMELKLNEVDITMSVQNAELHETFGHIDPKSICELKFYMINSLLELNNKFDVDFRLSLYNMLLIDARQIYGPDYQLLAASHEHILLDSSTGSITNQMISEFTRNQKPLICINMVITSQIEENMAKYDELSIDASFSTLDLVLNPETLSEIVILLYGVYLNIKPNYFKMDAEVKNDQKSELKSSVNFRFKRLTGLMFKIEEEDKARKVALFSLDGVLLNLTLAPNDRFLDMSAQVDGFNVTSLLSNSTTVFTIGQLQDKSSTSSFMSRGVFNVDFCKKCIDSQEVKELELKIASLCYLHKPELINELQSCFKDFMRFHEKIMEEVADKAARLALEMLNKGKTYLKDRLARKNSKWIKVKVQLQTPVVGVRLKKTDRYFVAHLGKITIENDIKDHSLTKFSIKLSDMTVFSMFLDRQEIQNLFKLFFNPVKRENLMDKTSIGLSLSYEHKQENALLVIQSVIDNCSITLSKLGIEQLVKISDSLVYDKTDEIRCESKSKPIDIKNNFKDSSKFEKNGICVDKAESLNDYEKIFHSISDDEDLEIDGEESLNIQTDVSFKIERLQMDFLADVEKANQHIAELCFKEYELNISKHYQNLTYVSMTLKSMHLIDKLIKSDDKAYLLWSGTSSKLRPDMSNKQLIENLSFSAPSLGKNMNFIKYYRRSKKIKKNDEFLKNILEMSKFYQCESISLPTELGKPKIQKEKSENFQSKPFGIRISESASNISSITEENTNPLVKINLIIIDEKNPNFSEKYQKINRFIDIKFSRLKLIVNPETWILVLDVLGLGAKSYPVGFQAKDFDEKKSSTGIKFMAEEFSIELNEDKSYQPLAKLKIDDVRALIESRPEYLNASGQLGSLGIHDVSACKGLYPDKFLTSGDQALKFEFFKHTGPLDHLLSRESFDTSLKLNMNSVKYVHTQRFLSSLTQYFQQFNKLQEALGKMNAISSGEKNISFEPQRSSRIKLDIQTESPIIVIPVNSNSNHVLVFNLGNIDVSNKFESSEKFDSLNLPDFSNSSSANNSLCLNDDQKHCLLDLIEVKFRNTQLYSSERYVLNQNSSPTSDLIFITFGFKNTGTILKTENIIQFHLERNLENEISHRSPDWYVYSKFSSVQLKINLSQYKIIRGLLDQNIGEQIQTELNPAFTLTNYADTITSVNQWKKISLMFDLENVFIELLNEGDKPLASAVFIISSLIFESFSDDSKLVDLVSNEIQIKDTREPSFDVLLKKNLTKRDSQRLQLEVHYKSKKNSNKYSILFNNCRVITIMDWLMEMNNFIKKYENQSVHSSNQVQVSNEVKVNLINTDFVLAEQISEPQSQAIILRLTAYFEYSELKTDPIDTRLQSFELFTCQMNDIEQTALSIIEPSTLSIALKKRNEFKYMVEMNAEKLRLRFSYLDFKLFIRVIKSVKNQIELSSKNDGNADHRPVVKNKSSSIDLNDLIVSIDSFSVCIIDDCNDIDIPLGDIQFKKLKLNQIVSSPSHGSVEFALNIDYFNRLLSDWEPLVEPWLAKLFWKSKIASNVLTLTSMDVLNVNLTNPVVNILTETLTNWKKDFDTLAAKNHKVFYPFVLVNSTGQAIQFMKLDADSEWTQLAPRSTIEFNFFKKKTLYGQKSHNNQLRNLSRNKIRLKLDDWCEIRPLTVDKVGTYFRDIYPMSGSGLTRLIFDISLHQNATKYIEIKSPVTVKNKLDHVLECRIECGKLEPIILELDRDKEISVPIKYLPCHVSLRPAHLNCQFSCSQLSLCECEPGHVEYVPLTCRMEEEKLFFFFARIMRHKFESDQKLGKKFDFIPGHSIQIEPAFSIQNLLPIELRYFFSAFSGRIDSDNVLNFYNVDVSKAVELNLEIDNYHMNKPLEINHNRLLANLVQSNQVPNRKYTVFRRVNFFDENNRGLFLIGRIEFRIGTNRTNTGASGSRQDSLDQTFVYPITLYLSAVYCFFNLTGLPLIFRQYNCDEASGQSDDHESVCSSQPLLFSFNDCDSPYACSMRIGKYCIEFNKEPGHVLTPKWCRAFGLDSGSSYRPVHVNLDETDDQHHKPDWVYYIGIDIKPGKDLHRDTTYVYFSTRYYLVNRSTRDLLVSQYNFVKPERENILNWKANQNLSESKLKNSILLLKESMSQYHWSRADLDQLLSLRPNDAFGYNWCGGFKIDQIDAFYINCRHLNKNEFVYFKVEIFLDGGTFYIVFTDNLDYPFPVRIENMSQVPVQIYQPSTLEESNQILIKSKQNFNYCWDELVGEHKLVIGVKGGTSALFDLSLSEEKKTLFYEDFFYVVFTKLDNQQAETDELKSEQELVLTCSGKRVYLDLKQTYNRNQLWNFSQDGHLVHVMSSPPKEMGAPLDLATSYVLDIEEIAPRPQSFMSLSLNRPDPRRRNTQCWLFEPRGKLCCNVKNMCLQVIGDLKHKAEVVLGPGAKMSYQVVKQQLRPGSGQVSVSMSTDGPCRLIRISNVKDKSYLSINWEKLDETRAVRKSFELYVNLSGGIGLSVINWKQQEYEELLYAYFKSIELSFDQSQSEQKFILGIQSIQVCNQLVDASRQNLAYSIQTGAKHDLALKIDFLRKLRPDHSPIFIQHLIVNLLDLNVHLEEKLLWKLIQFLHATKQLPERIQNVSIESNNSYYRNQIGKLWRDSQTPRFSFAKLHISEIRMSLSVYKTAKLSADLQTIKSDLGIPLVQFENAAIVCKPFMIINEHDTASCLIKLMSKHYGQELRSHAIRILGSVDFLGNPIGLVVDFKESLTNVISNGHVPDFVFSITHGVANSVSKFSGSLSDELNGLTMDENYQQVREQIRTLYSNGSMDHFVGGALGFAAGVFGGMISLGTQTYQGFSKDGIGGAVTGLMRGAVGTVSKPVVGVLDFATGIASAIKETSKTGSKMELPKIRESRCCSTSGGLLTLFSRFDANGQKILYQVNDLDLCEKFIAMEQIRSSDKTGQNIILVTDKRILFVRDIESNIQVLYEYKYEQLKGNRGTSVSETKNYANVILHLEGDKQFKIPSQNLDMAIALESKIRSAKENFDEKLYILHNYKEEEN